MKTEYRVFPSQELIVLDASGRLDLPQTKEAIKTLASSPEYREYFEVLMDFRGVRCGLTEVEVYEIACFMAWPDPALPTGRKVAVLVSGDREFGHARFLELCARNRGMRVRAFQNLEEADAWLTASLVDLIQ